MCKYHRVTNWNFCLSFQFQNCQVDLARLERTKLMFLRRDEGCLEVCHLNVGNLFSQWFLYTMKRESGMEVMQKGNLKETESSGTGMINDAALQHYICVLYELQKQVEIIERRGQSRFLRRSRQNIIQIKIYLYGSTMHCLEISRSIMNIFYVPNPGRCTKHEALTCIAMINSSPN